MNRLPKDENMLKQLIPKDFIKDLEKIFEAAMEDGKYSAALNAKKLQLQFRNEKIRLSDLDDETLRGLLDEPDEAPKA